MNKVKLIMLLPVIMFAGELKDVLLEARKESKPIMVYVEANDCQYCDKMKENTLSDPSVQANISDFLVISTDKDSVDAQKYLPPTRYTPTVYFISSKFKVVNTVKGYLGKDDFNLWIEDTKSKLGITSQTQAVETMVTTTQSDVWMYDIASAKDYASQTGKQLMVYVDLDGSKWSKKMRKDTFVQEHIKEALSNFVWVKVQKNSREAKAYNLDPKYAPSVYFMRADGSTLATAEGYFAANDFLQWINYAKSKI